MVLALEICGRGSPMQGMARAIIAGLVVLVLAGCSPAVDASDDTPGPTIDLEAIDTESPPEGPTVGELITVEDFQDVLGTDDLTLSAAT